MQPEHLLTAAFSRGGDGLDAVEEVVAAGSQLGEDCGKAGMDLLDIDVVTSAIDEAEGVYGGLETGAEVLEQLGAFGEATRGFMETGRAIMHGPVARAQQAVSDVMIDKLEQVDACLVEGGRWVIDTCEALTQSANEVRQGNPGRYARL